MATGSCNTDRIRKLNSKNYHTWKFDMQYFLKDYSTWGIVSGNEKQPALSPSLPHDSDEVKAAMDEWDWLDAKACRVIILSVGASQKSHLCHVNSSSEMWETLKKVYYKMSLPQKIALQRTFFTLNYKESEKWKLSSPVQPTKSTY